MRTFSSLRHAFFFVRTFLAREKTLSLGTLVPGAARYFGTSLLSHLYFLPSVCHHHLKGSFLGRSGSAKYKFTSLSPSSSRREYLTAFFIWSSKYLQTSLLSLSPGSLDETCSTNIPSNGTSSLSWEIAAFLCSATPKLNCLKRGSKKMLGQHSLFFNSRNLARSCSRSSEHSLISKSQLCCFLRLFSFSA